MASKLYTAFSVNAADQFVESLAETVADHYYVSYGKHVDYTESSTPAPLDSAANSIWQTYDEMIGGKRVRGADVTLGVQNYNWTNGTIYTAYDNTSTTLEGSQFYATTTEGTNRHVWKCIDNNGGAVSNQQPLFSTVSSSLEQITINTNDGYQWRFMYTIDDTTNNKFSSNNFIPVVAHSNASGNAINGAIDFYKLSSFGNGYAVFANGAVVSNGSTTNTTTFTINSDNFTLSSNDDFYNTCGIYFTAGAANGQYAIISDWDASANQITVSTPLAATPNTSSRFEITPDVSVVGNGTGAKARVRINTSTNTAANVQVIQRGSGYTHAEVTITGNNSGGAAAARAVISPPGGHASDPKNELYARYVIISTQFANNELTNLQTHNDFRTVGLLKNPQFANVQVTYENSSATLGVGNTVSDSVTGATGIIHFSNTSVVQLSNVVGTFIPSNTIYTSNVTISGAGTAKQTAVRVNPDDTRSNGNFFQQTTKYNINMTSGGTFSEDEVLTQDNYTGNAVVYFANTTQVSVTSLKGTGFAEDVSRIVTGGTSGQTAIITDTIRPDLNSGSGTVLYLENIAPVSRSNTNTEALKLVIKF